MTRATQAQLSLGIFALIFGVAYFVKSEPQSTVLAVGIGLGWVLSVIWRWAQEMEA